VLKWELRDGIEGIIQPEKGSSTYIYDESQLGIFTGEVSIACGYPPFLSYGGIMFSGYVDYGLVGKCDFTR
jgi:hypothetical protein